MPAGHPPVGGEAEHAELVVSLALQAAAGARVAVRVHPVDHPAFDQDVATVAGKAGGLTALTIAARRPGLLRSLVLVDILPNPDIGPFTKDDGEVVIDAVVASVEPPSITIYSIFG